MDAQCSNESPMARHGWEIPLCQRKPHHEGDHRAEWRDDTGQVAITWAWDNWRVAAHGGPASRPWQPQLAQLLDAELQRG